MNTLKYILRHGWFWPFEFWLRPFAVRERIKAKKRKELWSALFGSIFIETLFSVPLWLTEDIELNKIWIVAVAGAVAGAGTVAVDAAVTIAVFFAVASAIFSAIAGANAISDAVIIATSGAVAGDVLIVSAGAIAVIVAVSRAVAGDIAVSVSGTIFFTAIAAFGITLGEWIRPELIWCLLVLNSAILLKVISYQVEKKGKKASNVAMRLFVITLLIFFSLFRFGTFTGLTVQDVNAWGLPLSTAITLGILIGIMNKFHSSALNTAVNKAGKYLILLAIFCWTPVMAVLFDIIFLQEKLLILVCYLFATPIISSGLFVYPLILPLAFWLYRPARLEQHSYPTATPLINFWQSLVFPLPRLKQYLALVTEKDIELGYATLRTVQTKSFQGMAARKAAQLVLNGKEGLAFAGYLAVNTNPATLHQLLLGPSISRSVAILPAADNEKIKRKYIRLAIYDRSQKTKVDDWNAMFNLNRQPIIERISAALSFLSQNIESKEKEGYIALLIALEKITTVKDFHQFFQFQADNSVLENTSWLDGGWQAVERLQKYRSKILREYQSLTAEDAKKAYLRKQQERLKAIDWSDLPWFWAGIAEEIVEIWGSIYEQEIKETRDWLLLDITPETDTFRPGDATLTLRITSKSGAIAQQIHLTIKEQGDNITWVSRELNVPGLLQGYGSSELRLDLHIDQPGRYVINGTLTALDLDERSYEWPVNFVLYADEKGRPYQLAEKQYYVVGPRLSTDLLFVGREQLLRDIRLLWQEPANKEALLLIGLRRMGKSSLLEKIRRDGINEQIIPLLIDLQGKKTQLSFLKTTAQLMAKQLEVQPPELLDPKDPGADFEDFLRSLTAQLADRYFLLMIDEANFFARSDYGELTHLLRSLMQAPDVPLLLLFCGTYELRQGARDYDSILYNTTRTKNVSYFNPTESAEVLKRPVQDFLEYDPQALDLAFQLTHGHPLLLQALGDQLIQTFDDTVLANKERSNYVTYGDMEEAGKQLSQKENPAFANYWEDADLAQQKVLVVMAASLDETSRKRSSLEYLLAQTTELRIPLERKEAFNALDQLTQEEQLTYADGGYSFIVALYRRWILWYYSPECFRESL